jgi:hypothetical protein
MKHSESGKQCVWKWQLKRTPSICRLLLFFGGGGGLKCQPEGKPESNINWSESTHFFFTSTWLLREKGCIVLGYIGLWKQSVISVVDIVLLDFDDVWTCRYQRFRETSPSSALKMETVCFSKTLISAYESTWRHDPEEQYRYLHRRENLIFQILLVLL